MSDIFELSQAQAQPQPTLSAPPRDARVGAASFAQERLWFLEQLNPGTPVYNLSLGIHLTGPLDLEALTRSLNEVVQRHEVLRTCFTTQDGHPLQTVQPTLRVDLPVVDFRLLPEEARAAEAQQQMEAISRIPFDLSRCPLLRATVLQLGQDEAIFFMSIHHTIADEGSLTLFCQELLALYRALVTPAPSSLPALPIQYLDFSRWQREQLQGDAWGDHVAYWRQQLHPPLPALALPTDRPYPAEQSNQGAIQEQWLPARLVEGLQELAEQEQSTLEMLLLSAFKVLLSRYSRQEDLVIGAASANRERNDVGNLIGFFVKLLPIRTHLGGNPTFRAFLKQVRERLLEAHVHQALPFEKLVEIARPERKPGHAPLLQVLFAWQEPAFAPEAILGLTARPLREALVHTATTRAELSLLLYPEEKGLRVRWEYARELFDDTTITRWMAHFETLLEAIRAQPDARVRALPLLTEAERHHLLIGRNPGSTPYPSERCVHQIVEAHAASQPEAIALVEGERRWSYRELDERANQLAHQLQALGVGPETRVGLYMERSALMIMGLLAILKAGGAYVPIDPAYPARRVAWVLEDTQAPVVLTQASLLEELPSETVQRLCLDMVWEEQVSQWPTQPPRCQLSALNTAYIIYTSGSTGQPKGVMIPHTAINRTLLNTDYVKLGPDDRIAHVSNTAFDAATFEIWGALLSGARLVIVPREVLLAPETFATLIASEGVSTLLLTTSLFNQLVYTQPSLFGSLRTALFGGEAASPQAARHLLDSTPPQRLINLYGPTESTVMASWYEVQTVPEGSTSLPIGQPVANTTLYVLDEMLQPVPVGVPGELHIGGAGLARGYLNRPDLTAERFIPDPFSSEPGARLYRTGDLVRALPDGEIDFVGRIDQQIKLRGFRIELGEIEATLSQHPGVREVAVMVREDAPGNRFLAAYLTLNEAHAPTAAEVRQFLQNKLPDYMIPGAVVFLPTLPLTPNGKIDQRALPVPEKVGRGGALIAPRTPIEELIATLFSELLGLPQLGIHDNFFEQGGHSLLATQALSRIAQSLQLTLPVSAFFQNPTVAGLAAEIERLRHASDGGQAPPLRPVPRVERMPLSYAQQRLWFLDQMMPNSPVYNVPFAIRLHGPLDRAALEQSLSEIVRRHEGLRSTFEEQDGQPYCRIHPAGQHPLTMEDLSALPPEQREALLNQRLREHAQAPFNLARGPLLRTHLLCLHPEDHILLLNVHHIVADGWSAGVFSGELVTLYGAFCQGEPSPLPELSIQYPDFAQWQRQWLDEGRLEALLPYWQAQLAQAPAALDLPTDYPRPPLQSFEGALYPLQLDQERTEALKALSRQENSTLFMTLLAAFQLLLHRYSGQSRVNVGTPIANRNRAEIEGVIGFFVNTLVLSTDLAGDPTFRELLQRVRQVTLGAYDHQDVPFDKIVEVLQAGRDRSRSPLFQVMLVLQNAPLEQQSLAGLRVELLPTDAGIAKFDLILAFLEQEGQLVGSIEYNTALFEARTIERMADQFRALLSQIIAAPEQPLSAFSLLLPAEEERLEQVAARLREHQAIQEAVVFPWRETPTLPRLVGYVVPRAGERPSETALRAHLAERLAESLLPASVVFLEHLPRTSGGQIDRQALPLPDLSPSAAAPEAGNGSGTKEKLEEMQARVTDRKEQLSAKKQALLEKMLRRAAQEPATPLPTIPKRPIDAPIPLSFSQEQLWFLEQLAPGLATYNMPFRLEFNGPLNDRALAQSFTEVLRRHEALRCWFESDVEGRATQRVASPAPFPLMIIDLRSLPASEQPAEVERLSSEDATRPFDLSEPPLLRATLLHLRETRHLLLLTMHHIVFDGWSLGLLVRELGVLYQSFVRGVAPSLSELPIQYPDYALWQREQFQSATMQAHLDYWKKQLVAPLPVLGLLTDYPRPPVQRYQGALHTFHLPRSLVQGLEALAKQEGCTLFMASLALFKVLLYRYTGQSDLIVGIPAANRARPELEGLIGFFVNMLALRTDLAGAPSFRELLRRVREVTSGAYAHQEVPFEKLVEALHPERDPSRSPFFQVLFAFQDDLSGGATQLEGLSLRLLEKHSGTAKFDLSLFLAENPQGIEGSLEYNTDLFTPETIQRMVGHFQRLLTAIVEEPTRSIADFPLLTEAEANQLLYEWNAERLPYDQAACMHQLVEAQAARTPDAIALSVGGSTVSYRELDERTNQLAHHLRVLGVGPEVMVGVCLERTPEIIIAILGILKAGGVYVPLDPEYPAERLAFILEDTEARVILTQQTLLSTLPAHDATTLCLDKDWGQVAAYPATPVSSPVTADNLAYIIYTSGSTGRPKGVAIAHRSAVAMISWAREIFLPEERAVVLAATSICFDLSVYEIFVPLSWGGQVVLARNALQLPELPEREQITLINTVPSAIAELVRGGGIPASVSVVNLAGEPLKDHLVQHIYRQETVRKLYNLYGPSEDTTYSTFTLMLRGKSKEPSVGRPLANSQLYLLDSRLRPVPVGVIGELYLGGDGLARGYLNRPALTAEKFIPDPFSGQPGARLYRTGDLGRYRPDGEVDFLGRVDHQVKIRGFRIELGEIEGHLNQHPAVREAVVLAREEGPAGKQLVAYVVPDSAALTVQELRLFLQAKVPAYMVPSAFVLLEALPLTPNGKLDRRALPAPERAEAHSFVAPRTPLEESLADVWAEVMGLEKVGIHDNFFELGGHSLLATQVVSRLRQQLQRDLPLQYLFEEPTIAALAERLQETSGEQARFLPPLTAAIHGPSRPLSFAQQRLWFLDQLEPGNISYNIPIAVRLRGPLEVSLLQRCLDEVVQRHETLRTTFALIEGEPMQVVSPTLSLPLPLLDLGSLPRAQQEAEVQRLALEVGRHRFDLGSGPLLQAQVLRLDANEHILLLCMHHIISDGWSLGVLITELALLYAAFTQGQSSPLPALPIQYTDFALWQQAWLQNEVLTEQIDYWKAQLGQVEHVLHLPTDRPRPARPTHRGAIHRFTLSPALSQALQQLSQREGSTLFMTLLATFGVLLYRYSGQRGIVVGTPIANRNRVEIEGLIGFFVNTLALPLDLAGNPSFRQFLARVREGTLGAYAHQELPFEKLVEAVQPERDLSRTPLFQVMFSLQNTPTVAPGLSSGLVVEPLEVSDEIASKFDFTLSLEEGEQGLSGAWAYSTDLFDAATIARMQDHFQRLLEQVVADPEQSLSALSLLAEEERRTLLEEWNESRQSYPLDRPFPALFEAQVLRTPELPALRAGEETLSYQALNQRVNRLAHRLHEAGVGPETLVALCLERSAEMLVGLLAILKAGGAYLPLDPATPTERLAFMLADSEAPLLLTQRSLEAQLPPYEGRVLYLDEEQRALEHCSPENPASPLSPDHLAYVIYTSGSTGRPKGTLVSHRALTNYLCWVTQTLLDEQVQSLPATTRVTFDASLKQLLAPLLTGRAVWLLSEEVATQPDQLLETLRGQPNVALNCVPSLWQAILDELGDAPAPISSLLLGGEAASPELIQRTFARLPGISLWNLYGPSEATANASAARLQPGDPLTMGHPIANTQIYLLDADLQPVPVGVPGELYIGGEGLSRGYLKQPGLTAERFVPHPFAGEPGQRLYRTGDLGRYLPDGSIEFLGRRDHQVKVRGFRVELGEIEAVLREHPAVAEVVVTARESELGGMERRLVAYIVPTAGQEEVSRDLPTLLREKLPEYMIPAHVVLLDALPLSPTGKLDRRALPAPEWQGARGVVAPRTPTEEVLAEIWAELLGSERIGVEESFFALGGHSLLATRCMSRIRQRFEIDLPLRTLFEHSTVAALAQEIDRRRQTALGLAVPPIIPIERGAELPLSFAQQRLWFLEQLEPGTAYHVPMLFRLSGPLDRALLERSFNEVIRRHEVLRSSLTIHEGQPVQRIADDLTLTLPMVDLRALPAAEREARARTLATESISQPFDLATPPLLRVLLLQLADEEHLVVLTMHHIVSDAWSTEILLQEVALLYEAYRAGQPSPLPELPLQYADFAAWQQQWLQGEVLGAQLTYWREQLRGCPATLELPTDRPRPAILTYRGARRSFTLPKPLADALQSLGRQEGVTLFMLMLAAFQTLLYRYTNESDIVVGSPIANRPHREVEGLIGFFLNTLVLRGDLSGNPQFRELLRRTRTMALEAYAHQDLPFERLVEAVQPERDRSRTPLFQTMFVLRHEEGAPPGPARLRVRTEELDTETAKFDLTLFLSVTQEGLEGAIEYSTDLFDAETIVRLWQHFHALLEGIVTNPDERLDELPLLQESERQQVLLAWNDTPGSYPPEQCVHELFEAQRVQSPEALAVVCGDGALSYQELDKRANQLAHYLRGRGIGPDQRVALCLPRSLEMATAVLGVLKAGAAYVPLDPAYPPERLTFMLADSRAQLLLTQAALLEALPPTTLPTLCLDQAEAELARQPTSAPARVTTSDHLLYVIYTSGSTGRPKGVAMPHRALVNLLHWQQRHFALRGPARTLQFASLSFDVSFQELFSTWMEGGTLLMVDEATRRNPAALLRFLDEQQVERLFLPFVALQQLAEVASMEALFPASLKEIITAGEQLQSTRQIVEFFTRLPGCVLHNQYGPSESHVVTALTLRGSPAAWPALPPIGRPVANTQIYLLDSHLQPVPVGVPGELYIGGVNLARGYLDRPALTAEKFVPNPFSHEPGARLYRTGDQARYLADGAIQFLGRRDFQVKVRGYRIELGELEVLLGQHEAVRKVVVTAPDSHRLVAYLQIDPAAGAEAVPEVRRFLQAQVPDHMIPSHFVVLEEMPLTPSGKIDRRALPAPVASHHAGTEKVPPRDALELQLVHLWQEVLQLQPIGITDNFFELGGHSILAVRLVAQMQQLTGRDLSLSAFFQHPTIEQVAALLRQGQSAGTASPLVSLRPSGSNPPFFCIHPGGGQALAYLDLVRHLDPAWPVYGLQSVGLNEGEEPQTRIEEMAATYLAAIRARQPEGPYRLGGWSMGGVVAFEMARQLQAAGERVALLALFDTSLPSPAQRRAVVEESEVLFFFAQDLGLSLDDLAQVGAEVAGLDPEAQFDRLLQHAIKKNQLPPDLTRSQMRRLLEVFRSNYQAMLDYQAQPYQGRVLLWRAAEGQMAQRQEDGGWGSWVTEGLELRTTPGNHFTLMRPPHVQQLADQLASVLCETLEEVP